MDEIRAEFIAAEECLIEVLESYMELVDAVLYKVFDPRFRAQIAQKKWQPLLTELKAKHAQHTTTERKHNENRN